MRNIARFEIIGRIVRTHTTDKLARVTIATNYPYKDGASGAWKELTDFNQIVAFRDTLITAAAAAKKGDLVRVVGRVRQTSYDKDGQRVWSTDLVADEFSTLARKKAGTAPDQSATHAEEQEAA